MLIDDSVTRRRPEVAGSSHTVLQLIDVVTFTGADFSIQHDGVCRMNPELARRVAQVTLERCEIGRRLLVDSQLTRCAMPATL